MPALTLPQHEAFAQARFSGQSVMDAYHTAGYKGESPKLASAISQLPEVKARILELHNAAATVVAYHKIDAIKDLLTIIHARPSEATADHPLCELRMNRHGEYYRFPSKLKAVARLLKLMGWEDPPPPDEAEMEPDRLAELLHLVRQGSKADDPQSLAEDELPTPPSSPDPSSAPEATDEPLTPRQEGFAQLRFSGMGVMEAYTAAGYTGTSPQRAYRVSQHPPVKARIAWLHREAAAAMPCRRHELINDLVTIIQATPAEAGPDHPLCELRMSHEEPYFAFPNKLHALTLLIRLMGWTTPDKPQLPPGIKKLDALAHPGALAPSELKLVRISRAHLQTGTAFHEVEQLFKSLYAIAV